MLVKLTVPAHMGLWEFLAVLVTGLLLIMAVITRDPSWVAPVGATLIGAVVNYVRKAPSRGSSRAD